MKDILESCEGFDWDDANSNKNWLKHKVSKVECEQVFFNRPLIIADDEKHSESERRWFLLGRTDMDRNLLSPTGIGGQKPSPLGEDFSTLAIWRIIEKAVIVSMI
ncbi:MAG: BrnT family toxin [Ignavibacteriaceae bacterium]